MVRKTAIKRKNNKKKNYTRRKKGGNGSRICGSGIFSFFGFTNKTEPDPKKTEEFIEIFKKHIKKIMTQQNNNNPDLPNAIDELEAYINNLPKDIDRAVIIPIPPNQKITSIRGLPIYIIGRIVKNENDRTRLKTALENKGFIYDKTVFNAIITKDARVKKEDEPVDEEDEPVENIPTPDEVEKQNQQRKEERRIIEEETKKRQEATRIEQEKQQELIKKAKMTKIEEARIFKEEQEKIKRGLEANTQRMKEEEEEKKLKEAATFKKNIEKIKKRQSNIAQQIRAPTIAKLDPKNAVKQQKINIENVRIAETKDEYLKALLGIKDNNIIIEQTTKDVKEETTKEVKEEPKEVKEEPKEVKKEVKESVQLVKIPKIIKHTQYDTNAKPEYWKRFFPNEEIYFFRDYMLSMLYNTPKLYEVTDYFFPAFQIESTNNKYINALVKDTINIKTEEMLMYYIQQYDTHIRFILLFIGIMTFRMNQNGYKLIIKGGKAIQKNCKKRYESNDIDILVLSDNVNKKKIAIELSKLLVWIVSQQNYLNNMSMIEIDQTEPIVKMSIFNKNYGFEAVVDIGFNDPKEEIKSYVTDITVDEVLYPSIGYPIQFISQSVNGMIKEKLYYYLKYVVLEKFTKEDNVEIFIPKIYRSLKALFGCIGKTNILLEKISEIISEKRLIDERLQDKEKIVNDIIRETNSA